MMRWLLDTEEGAMLLVLCGAALLVVLLIGPDVAFRVATGGAR